jgi:Arc/MetJ-type ribon-helix-helix transcriptional regulator
LKREGIDFDAKTQYHPNMKTIAITVDEETLDLIDRLHRSSHRFRSRSALVRAAIRAFAAQEHERRSREREAQVIRENKRLLDRQLRALVKEQATP